jgi:DNA-binding transcriptional LysR family regulator
MNYTHIRNVDLNLLVVFNVLMEERSVTGAARRLFLSQPAVSHALDRLQAAFKDELLVRTAKGYEPTHRAFSIHAELREMLPKIDAMFGEVHFDPRQISDTFRIEATDWGATVLLPRVIRTLAKRAPGVRVDVVPTRIGFERLESNEVDLVLSPLLDLASSRANQNLRKESLLEESLVCLARVGHPLTKRRLTLRAYLKADHISLSPMQGRNVPSLLDRQPAFASVLEALGGTLNVHVRIPYFVPLCLIVENTDLIATVPFQIARQLKTRKTRIIRAPKEFRSYTYDQIWHSRNDSTPVHEWIRKIIRSVARRAQRN